MPEGVSAKHRSTAAGPIERMLVRQCDEPCDGRIQLCAQRFGRQNWFHGVAIHIPLDGKITLFDYNFAPFSPRFCPISVPFNYFVVATAIAKKPALSNVYAPYACVSLYSLD